MSNIASSVNVAWKRCVFCDIVVSMLDFAVHEDYCHRSSREENKSLPHGYIWNGIFYAMIKKIGKEDILLPSFKNGLILIHPATMKFLKLTKETSVVVSYSKNELVLKCWPCLKIQYSEVILPVLSIFRPFVKSHVQIANYNVFIDKAELIVFNPVKYKPFMDSPSFKNFVKKQLEHIYIREGIEFMFSYLDYPCHIILEEIIKCDSFKAQAGTSIKGQDLHDFCETLSNFHLFEDNLENSTNFEFCNFGKSVKCSTPVSSPVSRKQTSLDQHFKDVTTVDTYISSERKCFYYVNSKTAIDIKQNEECEVVTFQNFGGLEKQIQEVKYSIDSFFVRNLGYDKKHQSILFLGSSGTGKSMMLRAIQSEYRLPVFHVKQLPSDNSQMYSFRTKKIFQEALENSPSIIFLDGLDSGCQEDVMSHSGHYEDSLSEISSMIKDLLALQNDVLVVATARSRNFTNAMFQKDVFDKEILFPIPSTIERKQIFFKVLKKIRHVLSFEQISELSDITHGFTGGDIKCLCAKANLYVHLRKNEENSKYCVLNFEDLKTCLKDIRPSVMTGFSLEVPNVKWRDIGGMDLIKNAVIEMVDWPLKHTDQFKRLKITPPRGILMYGPPGCSKTMIAKALVSESHLNFISVKGPQLFNKYVGESEKCVSELFKKARCAAPCVIFFDEIDSLAPVRGSTSGNSNVADRVLTQLLVEIDGIDILEGVSIIAATNRPDMIDPSLLRPGRFDHMIYVPLPDAVTRREIFEVKLKKMPLAEDVNLSYLVDATDNYTGAEIIDICREAAVSALKDDITSSSSVVTMYHFLMALQNVVPRTTTKMIEFYENYNRKSVL